VNNLRLEPTTVEAFDANWKNNTNYGGYTLACSLYTVSAPNDSEANDYAGRPGRSSSTIPQPGISAITMVMWRIPSRGLNGSATMWIGGKWSLRSGEKSGRHGIFRPHALRPDGLRASTDTVNDLKAMVVRIIQLYADDRLLCCAGHLLPGSL